MTNCMKMLGDWGENIACQYLIQNGYQILEQNYKAMRGEIDIIAQKQKTIVFVEVKSTRRTDGVPPELRINQAKQRQLYKIANLYISRHFQGEETEYQMDVIAVAGTSEHYEVRHHQNAFYLL